MGLWLGLFGGGFVLLCFVLHQRGFFRRVYLASKIPGPSMFTLLMKFGKKLLLYDVLDTMSSIAIYCDYKPYGIWLTHNYYAIVMHDMESVRQLFTNKDFQAKPEFEYREVRHYFGDNHFTCNGENVKRVKKAMAPGFKRRFLEQHFPRINDEAQKLTEELQQLAGNAGDTVDARLTIRTRTFLSSLSIIFSGTHAWSYSQFQEWMIVMHGTFELISMRAFNPYYFWLVHRHLPSTKATEKKIVNAKTEFSNAFREEIRARRDAGMVIDEEGPRDFVPRDFVDLAAHTGSGSRSGTGFIDEDQAVIETVFVMLAGAETTSATINVCLLLLALHQDHQERALREVDSVLGDRDQVTAEDLTNMPYLETVLKETLRLFPVAPTLAKTALKETTLNGFTVPKDTVMVLNLWSLHRNPNHYEDPLKFNPDRFASGVKEPFSWLPFSYGQRICPGQYQGASVLKVFVSQILRKFRLVPGDGLKSIDDIKVAFVLDLSLIESPLRFIPRLST